MLKDPIQTQDKRRVNPSFYQLAWNLIPDEFSRSPELKQENVYFSMTFESQERMKKERKGAFFLLFSNPTALTPKKLKKKPFSNFVFSFLFFVFSSFSLFFSPLEESSFILFSFSFSSFLLFSIYFLLPLFFLLKENGIWIPNSAMRQRILTEMNTF